MAVYLISLEQVERIAQTPESFYAEAFENRNDAHPAGAWATTETLEALRAIDVEPTILEQADDLPVFHGFGSYVDTAGYVEALTAVCKARPDGDAIRGISYVGHNCESRVASALMLEPEKFLYYTREPKNYLWRIVADSDDAGWCWALWEEDENFLMWLEAAGVAPDRG